MPPEHLEHHPDAAYFTDATGEKWRVHDVTFAAGRFTRVVLEAPTATSRIFVSASGMKRSHTFTRGESHGLAVEQLARQLAGAGYLAQTRHIPAKGPR